MCLRTANGLPKSLAQLLGYAYTLQPLLAFTMHVRNRVFVLRRFALRTCVFVGMCTAR